jgi:hypothetical protein
VWQAPVLDAELNSSSSEPPIPQLKLTTYSSGYGLTPQKPMELQLTQKLIEIAKFMLAASGRHISPGFAAIEVGDFIRSH